MARIRSIHPGIFTDEAFASVHRDARFLFIGLWCEADDNGVFEWKPLSLKMRLFPADGGDVDINRWLEDLADKDMVHWFEHDGRQYGAIRNFCRYQRPRSPKYLYPCPESIARYVAKDGVGEPGILSFSRDMTAAERKRQQRQNERAQDADAATRRAVSPPENRPTPVRNSDDCHALAVTDATNVTPFPSPLQQPAEMSRQMEEVYISDTTYPPTKPPPKRARISYPAEFEDFWQAYPRDPNMSKSEALKAWKRLAAEDQQQAIQAVPRFKAYCARKPDYRPVHACRFLSHRRFEGFMSEPPPPASNSRASVFSRG